MDPNLYESFRSVNEKIRILLNFFSNALPPLFFVPETAIRPKTSLILRPANVLLAVCGPAARARPRKKNEKKHILVSTHALS
jgi:hypothetical protein